MKWSLRIGRPFGIDTEVHASFGLLLAWVVLGTLGGGGTAASAAISVVFLVGVFASVVLHELGHARAARRYGIRTRRILLLPIGGMAQLEHMPKSPRAEMFIALAGPAVSLAVAGIFALGSAGLAGISAGAGSWLAAFVGSLMWANLILALFNLVPAFPMDGGRALRAFLAARMPHLRATEIAVSVGKVAAVALAVAALFGNLWLLVIAGFIWFAASAELRTLRGPRQVSAVHPHEVEILAGPPARPRGRRGVDPFELAVSRIGSPRVVVWRQIPR